MNNLLILIPTYNEVTNVVRLFNRIVDVIPNADILFIDDNSPDGTGDLIEEVTQKYDNVKVIHRSHKMGIGSAHKVGIAWAYNQGYKNLLTMDSDFTHNPEYIPELLKIKGDVVIGSRFLNKTRLKGWGAGDKIRATITHFMVWLGLGLKYDCTTAFRLYRLDKIPNSMFIDIEPDGYPFLLEALYKLYKAGYSIKELSTIHPPRKYGYSKMKIGDILACVIKLAYLSLFKKQESGWDNYWKRGGIVNKIYGVFATFYRKVIFKPSLNYYVNKYTTAGMVGLHAGCGSGQVDEDIRKTRDIIALDNSVNAINLYRINNRFSRVIVGDIMDIKLKDRSVDFIYNLGVMEHFTEEQLSVIFKEFHRVLKDCGHVILFWPPEFGLTVNLFKVISVFFKGLIPEEITRIKSEQHAVELCDKGGFTVVEYYFGIRDLFTQCVIVLEKDLKF